MTKISCLILFASFIGAISSCNLENNAIIPPKEQEISATKIPIVYELETEDFDIDNHLRKYDKLKMRIKNYTSTLNAKSSVSQDVKVALAQDYLSTMLIDSIFPYWIGTPWDFNGHTDEPLVGEVACGYFVSTTIRDLDVKINRYKVAQKASSDIIRALCDKESIMKFNTMKKLEIFLDTVDDNNVLIIGLDFHVGFFYKKNDVAYFAHSNYENAVGVEIVPVEDCFVLESSNLYIIGNFSSNKNIVREWLKGG